jgi:hypothetical protein
MIKSMTKLLFMCLNFSFLFSATAQEPTKPTYENKVHEEDGKYFVQKSLPVYLSFSTTPDGKDYPLKSKVNPKDANPMYLDTEGINYIRSKWAVDPASGETITPKREVLMEMYADGLAPRTTLNFSGAPRYNDGSVSFFGKGLNFDLSAKDGVSGVSETQFSLSSSYAKYSTTVSGTKEGANTLYYYSADKVGNAEKTRSNAFTVDLSPPSSAHSIVGILHNSNIIAPSTKFSLSTTDNLSGIRSVVYSFDSQGNETYVPNISVNSLADGDHTLHYYATDNVKNEATKKSFSFYLDKIVPVVSSTVVGDQHKGNYMFVSSRTKINLAATDNKAGVKQIYQRLDSDGQTDYSSNFSVPNKLGLHYIKYRAVDNVENMAANKTLTVYMDNKSPETGIIYGSPQFFHRDTLFITSQTPVTLRFRDVHSGIKSTSYSIDGASKTLYAKFTVPGEGNHSIGFNSVDNVNNNEEEKSSKVFVDNTAPEIFINFSIEPIGVKNGVNLYPNYVRMYIGATDQHVGTETLLYSIDGAPLTEYSSPRTLDISELNRFKKMKKYRVRIVAKDKLNNESEKIVEFFVGNK